MKREKTSQNPNSNTSLKAGKDRLLSNCLLYATRKQELYTYFINWHFQIPRLRSSLSVGCILNNDFFKLLFLKLIFSFLAGPSNTLDNFNLQFGHKVQFSLAVRCYPIRRMPASDL